MLWPIFVAIGLGIAYGIGRRRGWDTSKVILVGVIGGLGAWFLLGALAALLTIVAWESVGK